MCTTDLKKNEIKPWLNDFSPEEEKRIADKIELHFTPKPGSGLKMAEIELSHFSRQCLNRRIPNKQMISDEIKSWT